MEDLSLIHGTIGSLAAVCSAAAWAFGSIVFRKLGDVVSPLGMNLGKAIIGVVLLGIIVRFIKIDPVDSRTLAILAASGVLGIALGDTFFFKALMDLGPRLTVLIGTLGPVLTVILAVVLLRERPSGLAWGGMLLTTGGVTWVLWEDAPRQKIASTWTRGIYYGLLSVLCMSFATILAKKGVESVSTIQATLIRLMSSMFALTLFGVTTKSIGDWLDPFFKKLHLLRFLLLGVVIIIFGGFWLSIVALKYIDASVATVLNSTSPLFILPMTALVFKEKISLRSIVGAAVAVAGVALIFNA